MKIEAYCNPDIHFDLELNYCGLEECTPDFVMNPHTRDGYLIHYITRGSGFFQCESDIYELRTGDIFMIVPDTLVSYRTVPEDPLAFCWFCFSGSRAGNILPRIGLSAGAPVRHLHSRYSINELIKQCSDMLESPAPYNDFMVQSYLCHILSNLADSYSMSTKSESEKKDIIEEHIERAIAYIKFNYMKPLSIQDIADYVGLERTYFSKIFHKFTGMTAQKYLLHERIQHSRQLLERTSYTLKQISSYVGIQDEYYFSRVFKLETGMSPRQYRETLHE